MSRHVPVVVPTMLCYHNEQLRYKSCSYIEDSVGYRHDSVIFIINRQRSNTITRVRCSAILLIQKHNKNLSHSCSPLCEIQKRTCPHALPLRKPRQPS